MELPIFARLQRQRGNARTSVGRRRESQMERMGRMDRTEATKVEIVTAAMSTQSGGK